MYKVKDFLTQARLAAGLTQDQLGSKLGYGSRQFISNWERGRAWPPLAKIRPLCVLLPNLDPESLFTMIRKEKSEHVFNSMTEQWGKLL